MIRKAAYGILLVVGLACLVSCSASDDIDLTEDTVFTTNSGSDTSLPVGASTLPGNGVLGDDGDPELDSQPAQFSPPNIDEGVSVTGALASRLYPGWCSVVNVGGLEYDTVSGEGSSIQARIDAVGETGGVVEINGDNLITEPLQIRSGVVLRGIGNAVIRSRFSGEPGVMISFNGGNYSESLGTISNANAFGNTFTTSAQIEPGFYLIGENGNNAGQVVRVTSVSGNTATTELPLTQDFSGESLTKNTKGLVENAGLENMTLVPESIVTDLISLTNTANVHVSGVTTKGEGGQIRSAILMSRAYRSSIVNNTISDANQLGDGGRGYGINIANHASNNLIQGNTLSKLRHSILIHAGAAGNVVYKNSSSDARHPNFTDGGPSDISFHGYASGNLVLSNTILRTHISDASAPGPNNTIAFNILTSGPLTLERGADKVTLLGNRMQGSFEKLSSEVMDPIPASKSNPALNEPKVLWQAGFDPFAGPESGDDRLQRGTGILDLDRGANDVYVDETLSALNFCSLG